eukprot:432588_1
METTNDFNKSHHDSEYYIGMSMPSRQTAYSPNVIISPELFSNDGSKTNEDNIIITINHSNDYTTNNPFAQYHFEDELIKDRKITQVIYDNKIEPDEDKNDNITVSTTQSMDVSIPSTTGLKSTSNHLVNHIHQRQQPKENQKQQKYSKQDPMNSRNAAKIMAYRNRTKKPLLPETHTTIYNDINPAMVFNEQYNSNIDSSRELLTNKTKKPYITRHGDNDEVSFPSVYPFIIDKGSDKHRIFYESKHKLQKTPNSYEYDSNMKKRFWIHSDAAVLDSLDTLSSFTVSSNDQKKNIATRNQQRKVKRKVRKLVYVKRKSARYKTEINLLHQLRACPYVVNLLNSFACPNVETYHVYALIFEYAPMTLEDLLLQRCVKHPLKERIAKTILSQILKGVRAIHKLGFVHKNIKTANILIFPKRLETKLIAKIADFGFAKRVSLSKVLPIPTKKCIQSGKTVFDRCGTPG